MKKIKLISLIMAIAICLTFCLAACKGGTAGEHDHVWDSGEITVEPTCHSEGMKTYHCTVENCEQTKTEPVQTTAHNWVHDATNDVDATCKDSDEKAYKCSNDGCTATKTEHVDKSTVAHTWDNGVITQQPNFKTNGVRTDTCTVCETTRTVDIDAQANFAVEYKTNDENSAWIYGTTSNFDPTTGTLTVDEAQFADGTWTADGLTLTRDNLEITGTAVIGYHFNEDLNAHCKAAFTVGFGGSAHAYVVVVDENGAVKKNVELNETAGALDDYKCNVDSDAAEVVKGDALYLVLVAETKATGEFSFSIYAPCLHNWNVTIVEPTLEAEGTRTYKCGYCEETHTERIPKLAPEGQIADFEREFADTYNGRGNWRVGIADYHFGDGDPFTFNQITDKADDAFLYDDLKITANTVEFNYKMIGFAYKFNEGGKVNLVVGVGEGDFSVRYAVSADQNGGNGIWGQRDETKGAFTFNKELEVNANNVLFVLLNKESDATTCTFSITVTKVEETFEPQPFAGANFDEDFAETLEGQGNWSVGRADNFSDEHFDFTKITDKNGDGNGLLNNPPWIEVHGDWMAVNGMVAIAYKFNVAAEITYTFTLKGRNSEDNTFAVRHSLGDVTGGRPEGFENKHEVTITEEIDVHAGDVLYILVDHTGGNGDQCEFTFVITDRNHQDEPQPFAGANFGEDFAETLEGQGNWRVGTMDYQFSEESPSPSLKLPIKTTTRFFTTTEKLPQTRWNSTIKTG